MAKLNDCICPKIDNLIENIGDSNNSNNSNNSYGLFIFISLQCTWEALVHWENHQAESGTFRIFKALSQGTSWREKSVQISPFCVWLTSAFQRVSASPVDPVSAVCDTGIRLIEHDLKCGIRLFDCVLTCGQNPVLRIVLRTGKPR